MGFTCPGLGEMCDAEAVWPAGVAVAALAVAGAAAWAVVAALAVVASRPRGRVAARRPVKTIRFRALCMVPPVMTASPGVGLVVSLRGGVIGVSLFGHRPGL